MKDFWVGPWLHCAPEQQFVNGRRAVSKRLCFGPAETQTWFVAEDGQYYYEETILEGVQESGRLMKSITKTDLLRVLDQEIALCRQFHGEELIPLFQAERDALKRPGGEPK